MVCTPAQKNSHQYSARLSCLAAMVCRCIISMANLVITCHYSKWKDPRWILLSVEYAFVVCLLFFSTAEACWTSCIRQHVKISDQLVLMKDCHFVSGNHAFAGHWWCHMGRGKLSIESIAISRFVTISSDFLRDDPTVLQKWWHFWWQPCWSRSLGLVPAVGPGPGEAVCAESVASGPKVLDVMDVAWETLRNNTLEYVTNIPCLWISRLWKKDLRISSNIFNLHEDGKGIGASWSFLQLAKSRQSGHGKVLTGFRQESGGQEGMASHCQG